MSTAGWRACAAATNGSDGSTAATVDELCGQRARTAPDVERPLAGGHPREIGHLVRQESGIPAHEPVVSLSGDIEAHGPKCNASDALVL
jgi:hypothetical protein